MIMNCQKLWTLLLIGLRILIYLRIFEMKPLCTAESNKAGWEWHSSSTALFMWHLCSLIDKFELGGVGYCRVSTLAQKVTCQLLHLHWSSWDEGDSCSELSGSLFHILAPLFTIETDTSNKNLQTNGQRKSEVILLSAPNSNIKEVPIYKT